MKKASKIHCLEKVPTIKLHEVFEQDYRVSTLWVSPQGIKAFFYLPQNSSKYDLSYDGISVGLIKNEIKQWTLKTWVKSLLFFFYFRVLTGRSNIKINEKFSLILWTLAQLKNILMLFRGLVWIWQDM